MSASDIPAKGVVYLRENPKIIHADYEPKPDITAYELACLMPMLLGNPLTEAGWIDIGTASRHLRRT